MNSNHSSSSYLCKTLTAFMIASLLGTFNTASMAVEENRARSAKLPPKEDAAPEVRTKPQIRLEKKMKARDAIKELKRQGKLEGLAKFHQRKADRLEQLMSSQDELHIDQDGSLFFVEEDAGLARDELENSTDTTPNTAAIYPLDQTFFLNSKPNSSKTIYLNFKGKTLTGTVWNDKYKASVIHALPFDIDNLPGSFNNEELARIQTVWKGVSESFAPFDVNVTTQEPPREKITRSSYSDNQFGTEVMITPNFTVAMGQSCGCTGYAYIGVFDMVGDYYKPAMVFSNSLGNVPFRMMGTTSHEIGHNLGLFHDGVVGGTAYYRGHGTGATGWGPIMGNSKIKNVIHWSKGEYPNANNKEDDLAIIQSNGLRYDQDDHGDIPLEATPMVVSQLEGKAVFTKQGIISTAADTDVFSFEVGAGPLEITALPASVRPRLDMQITLIDKDGNELAQANPPDRLDASLLFNVPAAGTYWLAVSGTGKAATDTDPGYSDYASLGHYTVSANASLPPSNKPPVASFTTTTSNGVAPFTVRFDGSASSDPDGTLVGYKWNFGDGTFSERAVVSKTFAKVGEFPVTLQVTDNTQGVSTATKPITTTAPANPMYVSVTKAALSVTRVRNGNACVKGQVSVVDNLGQAAAGAKITFSLSGAVNSTITRVADETGNIYPGQWCKAVGGSLKLQVENLNFPGHIYDPAVNKESSASITF